MTLDRLDQLVTFSIWEPKYSGKVVLLKKAKVDGARTNHLKVVFTKAPSMTGDWYVSRTKAKKCLVHTNGAIQVYAVPLKLLEPLFINQQSQLTIW